MSGDEDDDIEIVLEEGAETSPVPGTSNSAPRSTGGDGKKHTPIWNHFEECLADPKYALCNHCAKKVNTDVEES